MWDKNCSINGVISSPEEEETVGRRLEPRSNEFEKEFFSADHPPEVRRTFRTIAESVRRSRVLHRRNSTLAFVSSPTTDVSFRCRGSFSGASTATSRRRNKCSSRIPDVFHRTNDLRERERENRRWGERKASEVRPTENLRLIGMKGSTNESTLVDSPFLLVEMVVGIDVQNQRAKQRQRVEE